MHESIYSMQTGKSPGLNGIMVAFYQKFWKELELFFQKMTQAIFQTDCPQEMNTGILRLLPKPKKDLLEVKSWRPICLQGVDIKIIAKILTQRLQDAISEVIHQDQLGFRKGRYIGEAIQMISDIIHYTNNIIKKHTCCH